MKSKLTITITILLIGSLLAACQPEAPPLGAGFRYSSYGPPYNPGPEYWAEVGQGMAENFPAAVPQGIWIVSTINGTMTFANFPTDIDSKFVLDSPVDGNEEILTRFDEAGVQVWLQVEPGMAPVDELIHAMLKQYGHHSSVIGVGVDVEWYQSDGTPVGKPITDEEAATWVAAAQSHGEQYRVFLKHWEIDWMPPTLREGLVFIDDSQGFESLDQMIAEFILWGEAFAPAPVGFQYGYRSDKPWWSELPDPPADIGTAILAAVPNTESLYWVDFTVFDIFPPEK